jgi:choline monooxygenase
MLSDYHFQPDLARAATLPARWYTAPEILPLERERIFARTWQAVGHTSDVARPGDFFACELLGEPLVVTRDEDGTLRAFYNVCRHRAGVVATGKGNRRTLQCQYHGWTYKLDGALHKTPEFEGVADFDPDCFGLRLVRAEAWGPYVFVNLDPAAEPLAESLGEILPETAHIALDTMRLVERRDYVIECNWKVYCDNYLEGYHIPVAHPSLYRVLDYENYRVEPRRYHSRQLSPLRPAAGQRYANLEADTQVLYYWVFPNFMLNIYPDNLSANIVLPLGPERTLTIFEWFFDDAGSGEAWETVQQGIAFSDQIQREDIEICEAVQRGLRSRSYNQGRFSVKRENGVHHFHALVAEFLNAPASDERAPVNTHQS